jgi:hypothetical protein
VFGSAGEFRDPLCELRAEPRRPLTAALLMGIIGR